MKQEMEQYLKEVMDAGQRAPRMASGSPAARNRCEISRQRVRRRVFEAAVQKRVDAAEAAFPPSARSDDGQTTGQ